METINIQLESVLVQSKSRPTKVRLKRPKGFWIHQYGGPSFYASNIANYKLEGFVKRVKAKAKQVKELKRNPRMILVPWKFKETPVQIISSDEFTERYANKMVDSRYYQVLKIGSTVHTRGRIIKRIKMKNVSKRKR